MAIESSLLDKSIPLATISALYTIKPLPEFDDWLNVLKDKATQQSAIEVSKKLAVQLFFPNEAKE
jgi:hypothetical protein